MCIQQFIRWLLGVTCSMYSSLWSVSIQHRRWVPLSVYTAWMSFLLWSMLFLSLCLCYGSNAVFCFFWGRSLALAVRCSLHVMKRCYVCISVGSDFHDCETVFRTILLPSNGFLAPRTHEFPRPLAYSWPHGLPSILSTSSCRLLDACTSGTTNKFLEGCWSKSLRVSNGLLEHLESNEGSFTTFVSWAWCICPIYSL